MSKGDMQVPDGWNDVPLGSIGKFSKGKGISKKDTTATGLPCIRYAEIYTDHDFVIKKFKSFIPPEYREKTKKLHTNDLVFAGSGETVEDIGKSVAFVGHEDAYVGGDSVVFSPTVENDSVFLAYQLNDDIRRIQLRRYGQGSSVIHIYLSELKKVIVQIPPLPEQKKIASILTSVDDVIEKTEAQISKLQDLKKGMMTELLTKGIGHTEFKDSPVGRIPVEWEALTLNDITKLIKPGPFGSSITKSMYVESGYKVYGQEQVISGDISIGDYYISEDKYRELSAFIVKHKDVLVSLVGTFGQVLVVPEMFEKGIINPRLLILRFDDQRVSSQFVKFQLLSDLIKDQLRKYQQGGTMGVLSAGTVKPVIVTMPPLSEQKEIASILTSIDTNIESKQRKLSQTKTLKKALMSDLLTGKVRVMTTTPN